MFFNRKKEKTKPKEEDNFTGWGCYGIIKDGKRFPRTVQYFKTSECERNGFPHPTQKPTSLFQWLIKSYSNENQLVLDCFGGSGTTAIACIETNRQYILFENNPQYCKIINDRIQSAKSHHFFLTFKKAQISPKKDLLLAILIN